ncbi:hypothetical protein [Enterococcus faecium]|uniref:hypothetical protein n=1 Tax=Enterococcus faecium TaxID=1352 RepID=UPI001E41561D|nr:hypothetical protein [Enterococcus faecium]MCD5110918.1 hypothetical protein [Enterococcus faecium]
MLSQRLFIFQVAPRPKSGAAFCYLKESFMSIDTQDLMKNRSLPRNKGARAAAPINEKASM